MFLLPLTKEKHTASHLNNSNNNNEATVVFVQNKATPEDMKRSTFAQIQRCIGSFFFDSKLNVGMARGGGGGFGGGGRGDGVYDGGGGGNGGHRKMSDVNLYFLPEMDNGNGR